MDRWMSLPDMRSRRWTPSVVAVLHLKRQYMYDIDTHRNRMTSPTSRVTMGGRLVGPLVYGRTLLRCRPWAWLQQNGGFTAKVACHSCVT